MTVQLFWWYLPSVITILVFSWGLYKMSNTASGLLSGLEEMFYLVVSVIIYSIIRSSIISIGRNPMAQSAVYRNVIQLSTLVLAILGVSVIAIYLILTRL